MIKKLFLPLTIFLLTSNFLTAQTIDQDNTTVGTVECNNLDADDFMDAIEVILQASSWTSATGDCNGNITYDQINNIVTSPPYDCNGTDVVEVEVDLDCDGSIVTITVFLDTDDTTDPFDHNDDSSLEDANVSGEQCTMNLQADIDDWIADIEANSLNGNFVFDDNCADPTALTITAVNPPVVDFTVCGNQVYTVTFDVEDECGNSVSFDFDYEVEDTEDPFVDSDPSTTSNECDMGQSMSMLQTWYDDILDNLDPNENSIFMDDCTDVASLIITATPLPSIDFTDCVDNNLITITATAEDACGNTIDEDFTYEILDTQDPFDNAAPGLMVFTCDNVTTDADIQAYITDILNNGGGANYFSDLCTAPGDLVISLVGGDPTPLDFSTCVADTYDIDFEIEDLCGNIFSWTGQVEVVDNTPPVLDLSGAAQSVTPECSNLAAIQSEVDAILTGGGIVTDDCTDLSGLSIGDFTITPDPGSITADDLDPGTNTCFEITFSIEYEDPCGNLSNTDQLTLDVDDTQAPILADLFPGNGTNVGTFCPNEIETIDDFTAMVQININAITDNCTDFSVLTIQDIAVQDEFYPNLCGEVGFIEWNLIDECGNGDVYRLEWTVDIGGGIQPLDWIGDPTDHYPEDISLNLPDAQCTNDFDPCVWMDNDMNTWMWEAIEDIVWEGGCDVMVTYSHLPCSAAISDFADQPTPPMLVDFATNSITTTQVCITITDMCDPSGNLEHCFDFTLQCGSCGDVGSIFCETCEDADPVFPNGCRLCDPVELQEGYTSCNPECEFINPGCAPINDGSQPTPLCGDGGNVPHNMSWFAFVASAEELEIIVDLDMCSTGQGVQLGIYDSCEFDDCVVWTGGCTTTQQNLSSGNFVPGQTYYMFVDGCNGDDCLYTVTVEGLDFLGLPEIDAITAFSPCRDEMLTDNFDDPSLPSPTGNCELTSSVTVCPGEEIQFGVIHQGNPVSSIPELQDECGQYAESLNTIFRWSTTWMGDIEWNPLIDGGGFIPPLEAPDTEGLHQICLEEIVFECDPKPGPVCLDVHVVNILPETYQFDVCIETLDPAENPAGFDPADSDQDPNMDGLEWLGDAVFLADVDSWPLNADGYNCNLFTFLDPDCDCEVPQELCIRPVGNRVKTDVQAFMWRCQFMECEINDPLDCDDQVYEWEWDWRQDNVIRDLEAPDSLNAAICLRIEGYSDEMDTWRPGRDQYCDTLPNIAITVGTVPIITEDLGCGAYTAGIDFDLLDDEYEEWGEIFQSSQVVEFIDCNTGENISPGNTTGTIQLSQPRDVCVRITFDFVDGAWWDSEEGEGTYGPFHDEERIDQCTTTYGPFAWGVAMPPPPIVAGDDTFCATDLEDHRFMVTNAAPDTDYIWNNNPIIPGVVVTDVSANGDGTVVDITFPSGYDPDDCVSVVADAVCGLSDPAFVCVNLTDPPTVAVDPISDICIIGAPDANAMTSVTVTATANPPSPNYEYTFVNGTNSIKTFDNFTTYDFPGAGMQQVIVSIEDTLSGCSSRVSLPANFMVIEPLEAPKVTCGNQGQNDLEITWEPIPGATGYTVFEDGAAVMDYDDSVTSHTTTGLALGTTVTYTVTALGGMPCFNSEPSTAVPCTTSNCPPASVTQEIQGTDFCQNDTPGVLTLADGFPFSEPNGMLSFESTPAGFVDPVTGEFDTDGLAPGTYDIQVTYTFDPQCPERVFNLSYEVLQVPDPSFEFETPVCVNDVSLLLDAPEGSVSWNYDVNDIATDDPVANADGDIRFTEPGSYLIEAISNVAGCEDMTTFMVDVIPELEAPNPNCIDQGLDFITAGWDQVAGATSYSVAVTINGTAIPGSPFAYDASDVLEYENNTLNEGDEVIVTVTAINDNFASGSCNASNSVTCMASNCLTFAGVTFESCDETPGMIIFAWEAITNIDSFELVNVTDPANPIFIERTDQLSFTVNNLGPMEDYILSVQPIHPQDGCTLPAETRLCTAPCPGVPNMSPINCVDSSLDFVTFEWTEVSDISGYEVIITINGNTADPDTINDPSVTTITIDNLSQDDEVDITITALNIDVDCGNGMSEEQDCIATSCIVPQFDVPQQEACWEAGAAPIQLEVGEVLDATGAILPGTITWLDSRVDANGLFTPDDEEVSALYEIDFEWADASFPLECVFSETVEIQVNIRPTAAINDIDDICQGDIITVSGPAIVDPQVTSMLDYDGGTVVGGDFPDGVVVRYDDDGMKTISLTQQSASDCVSDPVEVSFNVGLSQTLMVSCGSVTISSVTFIWNELEGAEGYEISIPGRTTETTQETTFVADNLTSQDPVTIVVTPINIVGPELCLTSPSATVVCTPSDCPELIPSSLTLQDFCEGDVSDFTLPGSEIFQGTPPAGSNLEEAWMSSSTAVNPSNGNVAVADLSSGVIDITYSATYTTVTGDDCVYTTMYDFEVFERPRILGITANPADCIFDVAPTITIEATGGTEPYTYEWLDNPPSQADPVYTIPGPGIYDMLVRDANGCTDMLSIPVEAAPVGEVNIVGDETLMVDENGTFTFELGGISAEPTDVIWFIDGVPVVVNSEEQSIIDIVANLEELGREFTLGVQVFFADNCFLTDDRDITIIDFERWYIPNVISAQADAENARWTMFTQGSVTVRDVAIYDRWGELVYIKELDPLVDVMDDSDTDATGQVWDLGFTGRWGNDAAGNVEQGVYVYVINLVIDEGGPLERPEIEAGDITVFR